MATETAAMSELLMYIVRELVNKPEALSVSEAQDEDGNVHFSVRADKEDLGRLIGRNGKTAKSIRQLVGVLGTDQDCNVGVEFVE